MIGYLFYDEVDIEKNQTFIDWLIDAFKTHSIELQLKTTIHEELPDFVLNRSRFHAISDYYEARHVKVYNSSLITRITNDKWTTYTYYGNEVPMMKTSLTPFYPCVAKSKSGHGGQDVYLLNDPSEYKHFMQSYIFQEVASTLGKDLRVYILNNQIYAAVLRESNNFKANFSQGANVSLYELNALESQLVEKVLSKTPIMYGGIDILFHKGSIVLNEIEDAVGARMLYNCSNLDVVKDYVKVIVEKLDED